MDHILNLIFILAWGKKKTNDENGETIPHHLETTEVILICFEIVNQGYQQDSRFLYIFVPNQSFAQLLKVSFNTLHTLKHIKLRVFIYWSMVHWPKIIKHYR